jgi:hypothetical protein
MPEQHILYHGTSWDVAQVIKKEGFRPSAGGCLGAGTYVARADKASKFAANCPRHAGDAGAVVKVRITFSKAKYVTYDDKTWQSQGYDACRADKTSFSPHPEWCVKNPSQLEVLDIRRVQCGSELPAFEGERLSLFVVRQLAHKAGLAEVYLNEQVGVVCFARDAETPQRGRHAVYYRTGTVCSTFQHPWSDVEKAHQLVRRKCTSDDLGLLFNQTKCDTACDCHGASCKKRKNTSNESPRLDVMIGERVFDLRATVSYEEAEVKAALEMLRRELKEAEAVLEDHRLRREEQARLKREQEQRRAKWIVSDTLPTGCTIAVRDGPSVDANTITTHSRGTVVSAEANVIVDRSGDKWIKLDGKNHYMRCYHAESRADYMHKMTFQGGVCNDDELWMFPHKADWIVWSQGVETVTVLVRDGPSVTANEIARHDRGTVVSAEAIVMVEGSDNKWIKLEGKNNYMRCYSEETKRDVMIKHELWKKEEELRKKAEEARLLQVFKEAAKEAARKKDEEARLLEVQRKEAARHARGKYFEFCLDEADHCGKCANEDVTCCATNGSSSIFLYGGGGWGYTSGLPDRLHKQLHTRARSHPQPTYVALGTNDRFVIRFANGKIVWNVGSKLAEQINQEIKNGRCVRTVAFGQDDDSYFVVYDDGSWAYSDIPSGLRELIESRARRADLQAVSLGPAGEWFLRANNGRCWWGGWSSDSPLPDYIGKIEEDDGDVKFIDFGYDDTYIIRYS